MMMMLMFVLVLLQPRLGQMVVVVGFTATRADAPCWPSGFAVFITVLDIQLCETGVAVAAHVAEHNTNCTTDAVDDKDSDDEIRQPQYAVEWFRLVHINRLV